MRTEVPWIAPGARPASAAASKRIRCGPCGPGTTTGSPSAVSNWHFSWCCLLVSSQSMSRNSTKANGGVGVWHCRQPSPSAWTFPDWASACAASDRNRLTLMSPPLRSNSRVPIPPLSFPNVQLAEGRSIPHPLRLTPSRRQDNTWRPVDLCCAIWAVAAGADRRGNAVHADPPVGSAPRLTQLIGSPGLAEAPALTAGDHRW